MANEYVTMNLTATIEGVTVVVEKTQIPLELLIVSARQGHALTNLIRQNVLKLVPTIGVRNAVAIQRRAEAIKAAAQTEQAGG